MFEQYVKRESKRNSRFSLAYTRELDDIKKHAEDDFRSKSSPSSSTPSSSSTTSSSLLSTTASLEKTRKLMGKYKVVVNGILRGFFANHSDLRSAKLGAIHGTAVSDSNVAYPLIGEKKSTSFKAIVVDKNPNYLRFIESIFNRVGVEMVQCPSCKKAAYYLKEHPDTHVIALFATPKFLTVVDKDYFNRKIKIPIIVLMKKETTPEASVTGSSPLKNIPVADFVPDMHDAGSIRWIAKKWAAVGTR